MTICPQAGATCIDDVCRGSGNCILTGWPMFSRCQFCGGSYSDDIECPCGRCDVPDDSDDDYEDDNP